MKKKKQKRERQQEVKRQKRNSHSVWFVIMLLASLLACVAFYIQYKKTKARKAEVEESQKLNDSIEETMIQSSSPTRIDPRFRPVLIYLYQGVGSVPAFVGTGTQFEGKSGPLVVTAEHMLPKKLRNRFLVFRFLSPDEKKSDTGVNKIAYKNTDLGIPKNIDVVFVKPGEPKVVEGFSEKSSDVSKTMKGYRYENVEVGGRVVKSLKSLVNGKEYSVIGASNDPTSLLVNYGSQPGESGTGFIDEYGRLYILSGSSKDLKNPVSIMCGPLNNLERL